MEYNVFQNNKVLDSVKHKFGWNLYALTDIFADDTKNATKIKKEDYLPTGMYPIIDQGQSIIAGYTNKVENLYNNYPVIIFGDHTRIIKYVNKSIFIGADGVKLLKPLLNKDKLNVKYSYYFLKTIELPNDGYSRHFKYFKQVIIPLPKIDMQNKIVAALDKAQELIEKRKAQIEALDELVKSVFYDMFGDPVSNADGWDIKKIGEIFDIKTGATPSRNEKSYWHNGNIPWIKTTELKENIIKIAEEFITEEGYSNSSVNMLPKDTILIAMYGQGKTRGMTAKLGIEATTNQACAGIIPNGRENMDFIWYQLRLKYNDLRELGRGGNQPNLNTNLIKEYELIYPCRELQDKYVKIIWVIEKQKEKLQQSLTQLEDNFNSLMQKAFNGDLFN